MSGRSCSEAGALFFTRDGVTGKETLDRAQAEEQPLFGKATPHLFDGRILVRPQGFEDVLMLAALTKNVQPPPDATGPAKPQQEHPPANPSIKPSTYPPLPSGGAF